MRTFRFRSVRVRRLLADLPPVSKSAIHWLVQFSGRNGVAWK